MSNSPPPTVSPPTGGIFPTPPISRGGARAAILSRLAAQGRSPDFLDDGAVGRLIDHARGSPRTLRAAVDATLVLASREGARRGDAALVGRALGAAAVPRTIVTARTRRALWLAGSGFAVGAVALIFLAPLRQTRTATGPETVLPAPAPAQPDELGRVPDVQVTASAPHAAAPVPAASVPAAPAVVSPVQQAPSDVLPPPPANSAAPAPPPPPPQDSAAAAGPAPAPASGSQQPSPGVSAQPTRAADASGQTARAAPSPAATVPPLAPDVGVAAPPLPAAPVAAEPPTALVLYAAGAPGVQQRLSSLSARLRQAGIGQVERRAVPAGTALGRPVSFFDRGDLALAQRAAGVLASEGWPNLPVDELAPRMIRPRAAWRQHHVVIEIQLP